MAVNEKRGEIAGQLSDLKLVLVPNFNRVSRAEQAIGKSCFEVASSIGAGRGLTLLETAVFLEQLTKPRLTRDEIGAAIMKAGISHAYVLVGKVCSVVLQGDGEDEPTEPKLPGEDDEEEGGPK